MIVIDWDDTLLPTHYLADCEASLKSVEGRRRRDSDSELCNVVASEHATELKELDDKVVRLSSVEKRSKLSLLALSSQYCCFIVTNATRRWVRWSAQTFLPGVYTYLVSGMVLVSIVKVPGAASGSDFCERKI